MIYASKDARKVLDHLEGLGIDVPLGGEERRFALEVACSLFYPNHIISVIASVLNGKSAWQKLNRAQRDGWRYFNKPVYDFLRKRQPAQRSDVPDLEIEHEGWASRVWDVTVTTLLIHDINRQEANTLLYEIPRLVPDRHALLDAIGICKNNQAWSIPYLHGILVREDAKREAQRIERNKLTENEGWEPDTEPPDDLDPLIDDWNRKRRDVDLRTSLERYAEDSGHRDGT